MSTFLLFSKPTCVNYRCNHGNKEGLCSSHFCFFKRLCWRFSNHLILFVFYSNLDPRSVFCSCWVTEVILFQIYSILFCVIYQSNHCLLYLFEFKRKRVFSYPLTLNQTKLFLFLVGLGFTKLCLFLKLLRIDRKMMSLNTFKYRFGTWFEGFMFFSLSFSQNFDATLSCCLPICTKRFKFLVFDL